MPGNTRAVWNVRIRPRPAISPGRQAIERRAVEIHIARRRRKKIGDQIEQRRFAGAIGADQCGQAAIGNVERDIGNRRETAEPLADVHDLQCAGGHRLSSFDRRRPKRPRPMRASIVKPRQPASEGSEDARGQILEGENEQGALGKPLVEREGLKDFGQQGQERNAHQRSDQRALAADDQHRDHLERARRADHFGRQKMEVRTRRGCRRARRARR